MKKTLLLLFVTLFLVGCNQTSPIEDDQTPINNDSNTENTGHEFINTSINTREDIIERINYYYTRLVGDMGEGEFLKPTQLSNMNETIYTRDDFDSYYHFVEPEYEMIEEMLNMTIALDELKLVIEGCESFTEDTFCDVDNADGFTRIKSRIEDGKLYIESYLNWSFEDTRGTSVSILFFDEISEKVHVEYVRDNFTYDGDTTSQSYYYDEYNEDGIQINTAIEDDYYFSYRKYDLSSYHNFRIWKSPRDYGVIYYDTTTDTEYYITRFTEDDTIRYQSVRFYNGLNYSPVFSYTLSNVNSGFESISFSLLDCEGWDKVVVDDMSNVKLYNGDVELLSEYEIQVGFNSYTSYLSFGYEVNLDNITADMISLENYGLSFNLITYSEFMDGISIINGSMDSILTENNMSTIFNGNVQIIEDMYPFRADPSIIDELKTMF